MFNLIQEELVNKYTPKIPYEDVTQEWLDAIDHSKIGKVINSDYFEVDGVRYDSSNAKLDMNFGSIEIAVAKRFSVDFHEEVHLIPRVAPNKNLNRYISTPDYFLKAEYYELKTVEGSGKESIINRVKHGKNQADNFLVNIIEKSNLSNDMIEEQIRYLYRSRFFKYVDKLIVYRNGKLYKIAQKKR